MRVLREELLLMVDELRSQGVDAPRVPSLQRLYVQLRKRGPVDPELAPLIAEVLNVKETQLWKP